MNEPITLNLGNGFSLTVPSEHIMMDLKVRLEFRVMDRENLSSMDCFLNYPSDYKAVTP